MIHRYLYNEVSKAIDTRPVVALLGARQVGKTTLAKTIASTRHSLYLDLESPEDSNKLLEPLQFFRDNSDKLIILDEIQRQPEIFTILRGVVDTNIQNGFKVGQFLLLGSASMDLLRQSSESLAGRITYKEMHGFNLLEVEQNRQSTLDLWVKGGFPESYLLPEPTSVQWREDLIRTYLERDIPSFGYKIPASVMRQLWTMMAHLQGQNLNHSDLANNLAIHRNTVNQYMGILEDLLLIRRLQPLHTNVKKRLVKSPKYYIRDSGLLHRLLNISNYDQLLSNPIIGRSWEGFVIDNISAVIPKPSTLHYYRTSAGAEIDLVLTLPNNQIWAIEIKLGLAPKASRGFHHAAEDINAHKKFIIYGGDDMYQHPHNTQVISLQRFLAQLISTV